MNADRARELLSYDPTSGKFRWLVTRNGFVKAGSEAGGLNAEGYRCIMIDGRTYRASRLAVLIVTGEWPRSFVDHRDLNRGNNSWGNLRQATPRQNSCNSPRRSHSTTGSKGVYAQKGRFRARIRVDGRLMSLGMFDRKSDAAAAYAQAAAKMHGEFARTA